MATTTTTLTLASSRVAYIGVGVADGNNPIPRAELNFISYGGVVTAAAAGEDQLLSVVMSLPASYAYVLAHCSMWMFDAETGDMADWDTAFNALLTNVTSGTAPGSWISGIRFSSDALWSRSAVLKGRTYVGTELPQKIIIPNVAGNARMVCDLRNLTVDGGPMTLYFLAKFLEFDLNQATHWAVNTPWPVR